MEPLERTELTVLRSRLATFKLEKRMLFVEIKSASTTASRSREAFARYTEIVMDIIAIRRELSASGVHSDVA